MRGLTYNKRIVAALYMRLSKEDETEGESGSIQHQRELLRAYANDNDIIVYKEFVDDGWSGTNFDRPGFKELLACIEKREINCVITKDLSRLGRNYIEVGYYTETYFPDNNIRYIAVNDRIDTDDGDSDIAPFLNIFNEFHAKQTSKKVRSTLKVKFENGGFQLPIIPYGYDKDPNQNNHLIINEDEAKIIRLIFKWSAEGSGARVIMRKLFDMKVECPGYKSYLETGRYRDSYEGAPEDKKYEWNLTVIRRMLSSEVYLGHTIHYKMRKATYKSEKRIVNPKGKWMIVKNTHEPIVSQELYDLVQEKIKSRKRTSLTGEVHIFAGLARCADCGNSMQYAHKETPNGSYRYLTCPAAVNHVSKKCTAHFIKYEILENIVLQDIQSLFAEVQLDKNALAKRMYSETKKILDEQSRKEDLDYESMKKRKNDIEAMIGKLYEDWACGKLAGANFNMLIAKFQKEQSELDEKLSKMNKLVNNNVNCGNQKKFIELIDQWSYPTKLTRELLNTFIEKVVIHEPDKIPHSRKRIHHVDIYYRFIGKTTLSL